MCIVESRFGCRDEEDVFRKTCITGVVCITSELGGGILPAYWRCCIASGCGGFSGLALQCCLRRARVLRSIFVPVVCAQAVGEWQ